MIRYVMKAFILLLISVPALAAERALINMGGCLLYLPEEYKLKKKGKGGLIYENTRNPGEIVTFRYKKRTMGDELKLVRQEKIQKLDVAAYQLNDDALKVNSTQIFSAERSLTINTQEPYEFAKKLASECY